jgi:hypothetical protein
MYLLLVAIAAFVSANPTDPCKLTTTVNGIPLSYDINILKREFDDAHIAFLHIDDVLFQLN